MESVTLTAQILFQDGAYLARIDRLPIRAAGDTVEEAQEELAEILRSWIQAQDISETLATELARAGFPGVDEDTEVQLEFVLQLPDEGLEE